MHIKNGSMNFLRDGKMHNSQPAKPSADGKSDYSTLAPNAKLSPGESTTITFRVGLVFSRSGKLLARG